MSGMPVAYGAMLLPFLIGALALAAVVLRRDRRAWTAVAIAAAAVLILTAVFDSLMIAADLFDFDDERLLGPRVGLAPVEDLGYALVALLVVVSVHRIATGRGGDRGAGDRRAGGRRA